jgi:hypothetical protein
MSEDGMVEMDSDAFSEDDIEARITRIRTWDGFEDDVTGVGGSYPSLLGRQTCPIPMLTRPVMAVAQCDIPCVAQTAPTLYTVSMTPSGLEIAHPEAGARGVSSFNTTPLAAAATLPISETQVKAGGVPSLAATLPAATVVHSIADAQLAVERTTVMLRNIPNNYRRTNMVELLGSLGLSEEWDFIYLPLDFKSRVAIGYAFVNFVSHASALRAFDVLNGFNSWRGKSSKVCEVSWSQTHQGLEANIELVRNSPMNRRRVPEECKPFIVKNGQRVALPPAGKGP